MQPSTPEGSLPSPDQAEIFKPDSLAKNLSTKALLSSILRDPTCREGLTAGIRTIANTGIALSDFIPAIGAGTSLVADGLKTVRRIGRRLGVDIKFLDLTPDVGLPTALGTEVIDFVTCDLLPSHAIEGALQLKVDAPKMKAAVEKATQHWRGEVLEEVKDFGENQAEITEAMQTFGETPPSTFGNMSAEEFFNNHVPKPLI